MTTKNFFIAVVPARKNSKGIKNKNLLYYKGDRIVNLAISVGLKLKFIDKVILSTDSEKIIKISNKYHKKIMIIKRKKSLSLDQTPMHPVLKDAVVKYESKYNKKVSGVIILDPTSPLRKKIDIYKCYKKFSSNKVDLVLTVHESEANPYFSVVEKNKKYFKLVKGNALNLGSRQVAPNVYTINTICWIYSRNSIVKSNLRIPKKTLIQKIDLKNSLELNTILDKKRLIAYEKNNNKQN